MFYKVLLLTAFLCLGSVVGQEETSDNTGEPEPLPTPEELRSPYRRKHYRGGSPSYNVKEAYNSLLQNKKSSNSHINHQDNHYVDDLDRRSNAYQDIIEVRDHDDDLVSSPSEYGGYSSASGYGKSCVQGYVNASAVALLAFLFLLNIVQDIIQQITQANRKRKKRGIEDEQSEVMQFINDGGLEALQEGLPRIVIPLLVRLVDAENDECLERPLCEANLDISKKYGAVGRVFAYLLSNVVSNAFSKADPRTLSRTLEASVEGRNEGSCDKFKLCYKHFLPKDNKEDIASNLVT